MTVVHGQSTIKLGSQMSIILNQIKPYPLKATYIAFKLTIESNLQLMAIHFFLNELNFTCFQRQEI